VSNVVLLNSSENEYPGEEAWVNNRLITLSWLFAEMTPITTDPIKSVETTAVFVNRLDLIIFSLPVLEIVFNKLLNNFIEQLYTCDSSLQTNPVAYLVEHSN
jgi:hypothetical protein